MTDWSPWGAEKGWAPAIDIAEDDKEVTVRAELPGIDPKELDVSVSGNQLTLSGEKQTTDEEKSGDVLYQGIAERNFERNFQLADHVQVKGASLENGLLHIDLVREIPEAMKPRAIPIASSRKILEVKPTKVAA